MTTHNALRQPFRVNITPSVTDVTHFFLKQIFHCLGFNNSFCCDGRYTFNSVILSSDNQSNALYFPQQHFLVCGLYYSVNSRGRCRQAGGRQLWSDCQWQLLWCHQRFKTRSVGLVLDNLWSLFVLYIICSRLFIDSNNCSLFAVIENDTCVLFLDGRIRREYQSVVLSHDDFLFFGSDDYFARITLIYPEDAKRRLVYSANEITLVKTSW